MKWIPPNSNINADHLSRIVELDDYSIKDDVLKTLDIKWGQNTVNSFACSYNAKLPHFNSKSYQPGTEAVDVFLQSWESKNNWLLTPVSQVARVIAHLRLCEVEGTLFIPMWKSSYFWVLLCGGRQRDLVQYFVDTVDLVRTSHPDCGVVILGDFNGVDTSDLNSHHALVQVVRDPTRGYAVLDLIVTNLSHLYSAPVYSAPLGSSDHNVICWKPLVTTRNTTRAAPVPAPKKCYVRRFIQSSIDAFGRWISEHCWFDHIEDNSSVDTLTESFTADLTTAIDIFSLPSLLSSTQQINHG